MKSLAVQIAALAMVLCLCACSNFDAEDRERYTTLTQNTEILSGADEPTQESALKDFSVSYLPDEGFNPFVCKSAINRSLFTLIYDSLFTVTSEFQAEPVLCSTFSVSADLKTYRIDFVSGVRFSDGTALTADDVAASLWAAKSSAYYAVRLKHVVWISALENGVEIALDVPYENLPLVLDVPIVKAASVENALPIGTGSYYVEASAMKRNSHDWHKHPPLVDLAQISLLAADSPNQIRDDFEFGNTDMVCTDPNAAGSAGYHGNYDIWDCPTTVMQYIGFNRIGGMFDSTALRSAMTFGIDRNSIILTELNGYAKEATLPCSPSSAFYDASLAEKYTYSPAAFRSALKSSGVSTKDSPAILIVCSNDSAKVRMAQAIAKALQKETFYVTVRSLDNDAYQEALKNGNYHMYYDEVKLPANFDLSCFFAADGNRNFGGIADPVLAELCLASLKSSGNYRELFQQIMTTAPICPIAFKNNAAYLARETIDRLSPAVDNVFYVSDGRTLADVNKSFEVVEEETTPEEPTEEPEE